MPFLGFSEEFLKSIIAESLKTSTPGSWNITRHFMYSRLLGMLRAYDGNEKRCLAISHSAFLARLLGLRDADVKFGFNPELQPYNHLDVTQKFLLMNQVDDRHIHMPPIDPELTIPCDLIVSLLSWGFHYPAGTYCKLAKRSLRSGGTLVLDVRKGTDYDCLKKKLSLCKKFINEKKKLKDLF